MASTKGGGGEGKSISPTSGALAESWQYKKNWEKQRKRSISQKPPFFPIPPSRNVNSCAWHILLGPGFSCMICVNQVGYIFCIPCKCLSHWQGVTFLYHEWGALLWKSNHVFWVKENVLLLIRKCCCILLFIMLKIHPKSTFPINLPFHKAFCTCCVFIYIWLSPPFVFSLINITLYVLLY